MRFRAEECAARTARQTPDEQHKPLHRLDGKDKILPVVLETPLPATAPATRCLSRRTNGSTITKPPRHQNQRRPVHLTNKLRQKLLTEIKLISQERMEFLDFLRVAG